MTVYYVTVNKPGYSPEGEPIRCESLEDARDALASEINTTADAVGIDDGRAQAWNDAGEAQAWNDAGEAQAWNDAGEAQAWNDAGEAQPGDSIRFAGYAHTITESADTF